MFEPNVVVQRFLLLYDRYKETVLLRGSTYEKKKYVVDPSGQVRLRVYNILKHLYII